VATGCGELRGATHDELPRTSWKRRGVYGAASRKEELRSEDSGRAWRARKRCGAARHDELPSSIRKSRREQRDASLTCNAWPANFFINHGISSPSNFSPRQSCSPRKITFRLFFSITKVCPDLLNLSNAGDSFAGISSVTSCYLFSRTKDLIAMF
jgi:hypothetical protein